MNRGRVQHVIYCHTYNIGPDKALIRCEEISLLSNAQYQRNNIIINGQYPYEEDMISIIHWDELLSSLTKL